MTSFFLQDAFFRAAFPKLLPQAPPGFNDKKGHHVTIVRCAAIMFRRFKLLLSQAATSGSSTTPESTMKPRPSVWVVEILGHGGPGNPPAPSKHEKPSQAI
jgi:hypothetical protein